MSSASYESILHLAGSLSREEKLRLVRELSVHMEERKSADTERSVLELAGLGAEIWNGIDAQEYVRSERAAWNG